MNRTKEAPTISQVSASIPSILTLNLSAGQSDLMELTPFQKEQRELQGRFERERAKHPDIYRMMGHERFVLYVQQIIYKEKLSQAGVLPPEDSCSSPIDARNADAKIPQRISQETQRSPNKSWMTRSIGRASKSFRGLAKFYGSKKGETQARDKSLDEMFAEVQAHLNGLSKRSAFDDFASNEELLRLLNEGQGQSNNPDTGAPQARSPP